MKRIGRLVILSQIIAAVLCLSMYAAAGEPGAFTDMGFTFILEDEMATVTGYAGDAAELVIPDALGGYPVAAIGDYAFYETRTTVSLIIPGGVKRIGEAAFYDNAALETAVLPDGLAEIGESAFESCSSLTHVDIPASVEMIGNGAFSDSGLTSVALPRGMTNIAWGMFSGTALTSVQIPETVYSIGGYAFSDCEGLTDVTIPDSVWRIGEGAFSACANLASVFIPSTVRFIHETAFDDCDNLTVYTDGAGYVADFMEMFGIPCEIIAGAQAQADGGFTYIVEDDEAVVTGYAGDAAELVIPDALGGYPVTGIADWAFEELDFLTTVFIPATVRSVGANPFACCPALARIDVSPDSTAFESIDGVLFDAERKTLVAFPPGKPGADGEYGYEIPRGTEAVGEGAFAGCADLATLDIPNSVAFIGQYAFYDCYDLMLLVEKYSYADYYAESYALLYETKEEQLETFESDGFAYTVTDGQATVTGYTGSGPELSIPDHLDGYPVAAIGEAAFYECADITSLTIPETVTVIGDIAFSDCDGLTSVVIPGSVAIIDGSFYHCDGLTSVIIEEGVAAIGLGTFAWCENLTRATIPASVVRIDDLAFHMCHDLILTVAEGSYGEQYAEENGIGYIFGVKSAESPAKRDFTYVVSDGQAVIVDYTGEAEVLVIPDQLDGYPVAGIGEDAFAFSQWDWLTGVTIPEGVAFIGDWAFGSCGGLSEVNLPNSLLAIGMSAFEWCGSLESITLPAGLVSIGYDAFYSCSGLTAVTIPASVREIDTNPFCECASLAAFAVEAGNRTFEAIDGVLFRTREKQLVSYPAGRPGDTYAIPEGTASVGDEAFYACADLVSVTIPGSVAEIGDSAFSGCYGLTGVTLSEGLQTIGASAFYNCLRLTSLTIPEGVTAIGRSAFEKCAGLTDVAIPASVVEIGSYAFDGCPGLTLTVAEGSYAARYAGEKGIPYVVAGEGGKSGAGIPLFDFLDDPALTAFAAGFETNFPLSVSVRHDGEAGGVPVTVTDPEMIRRVFEALRQITVLGERPEGSGTDDYLNYYFEMADGSEVYGFQFQRGMLMSGWASTLYQIAGYDALQAALPDPGLR